MSAAQKVADAAVASIGFLLDEGFCLMALAAALEPLRMANQLAGCTLYRWQTLSLDGRARRANNGMWVTPDRALGAADKLYGLILCRGDDEAQAHRPELECQLCDLARAGVFLGAPGLEPMLQMIGGRHGRMLIRAISDGLAFEPLPPPGQMLH
ncbi:hypothetical protein [Pseudomonas sp. AA-38]|uniref:hypothetical protein n=1 Tax=Pseudomonas sp. AA-38 TaxID=3028807 RepID=UPI0023F921A9|nr:hypothetical protein [Pseudomonas sp. AA-38]